VKTLRQLSAAMILSLTLAVSVLAGQVESPGAPAPVASSTSTTTQIATSILLTVVSLVYR
jgi:hypothetical protein